MISKSFKEGTEAARWECDGSTEFELTEAKKDQRGTDIISHQQRFRRILDESESKEF